MLLGQTVVCFASSRLEDFFSYLSQLVRGGAKIYESLWQDLNPPISFGVKTLKHVVFSKFQINWIGYLQPWSLKFWYRNTPIRGLALSKHNICEISRKKMCDKYIEWSKKPPITKIWIGSLHSCRKGLYNSKFFCKMFWSQHVR